MEVKVSKTCARPTEEEASNFNALKKQLPKHIRQIDNELVLAIMDRLLGEDGIEYENVLRELNKKYKPRDGKFGNQFYDEDLIKEKHPTGIIFGKIVQQ